LAAHRNGLTTVILPKRNEPDIEDVPDEIKKSIQFIFVESVDEALAAALEPATPAQPGGARKKTKDKKSAAKDNAHAKSHAG
jgi:ATP-dependent Lon protease